MTKDKKMILEEQMEVQKSSIAYDIREFTIEYYVDK